MEACAECGYACGAFRRDEIGSALRAPAHDYLGVLDHSGRTGSGRTLERPGFDPSPVTDFWDTTNRQDWAACESVQRGLSATEHPPGPLAPREDGVYRHVTMVARGHRGTPLGFSVAPRP